MSAKTRRPARPTIEALEARDLPTTTAVVANGSLLVRATAAASIQVLNTAPRQFTVRDGDTTVAILNNVTRGINVEGSRGDDQVLIDLKGNALGGPIAVGTGAGSDGVAIVNGRVNGPVQLAPGQGDDSVALGTAEGPLTIARGLTVDGGGGSDRLQIGGLARVNGGTAVRAMTHLQQDDGSVLAGGLNVTAGTNPLDATFNGRIDRSTQVTGGRGNDRLNVAPSAMIDDLVARMGAGDDEVNALGRFNRRLLIDAGAGNDAVLVRGSVGGRLTLLLGDGDDLATIAIDVSGGPAGDRVRVLAGNGADTLLVNDGTLVNGRGSIGLEAGNDTFALNTTGAGVLSLRVDGGFGFNTFTGNPSRLRFPPGSFQRFT